MRWPYILPPWPEVTLGAVCEFKYGKSLAEETRTGGTVCVYGSNGAVGFHSAAITDGPTIIVGRKGSFGEVHYSPTPCWPIDTTYFIDRSATKADLKWLAYRLAGLGLKQLNRAAAIPGLNREDAYRTRLLLPPLAEQQRIAAVLDQAESVRAKRRDALVQLDALMEAIFADMFEGSAARSWPVTTIAQVADARDSSIRTGPFGSQLLHSEFVDEGVAVLGIDNAVANEFRWGERRFISQAKYQELKRYTVRPRDVLITIMGTCGRCAIVPDDIPLAVNTKHLCCITLDPNKCLPAFLHSYFLRHSIARRYLAQKAKGAIMEGLNMGIIQAMPLKLPPLPLQREYAKRIGAVDRLRSAHRASLVQLDALFASLQHRAFRGEL